MAKAAERVEINTPHIYVAVVGLALCSSAALGQGQPSGEGPIPFGHGGVAPLLYVGVYVRGGTWDPASLNGRQWEIVLHHMRVRANLTAEEHELILEFLKAAN